MWVAVYAVAAATGIWAGLKAADAVTDYLARIDEIGCADAGF